MHCYRDNYILLPWQLHIVTMTTAHCNHDNCTLLPWQQHTVTMTTTYRYHENYTLLPWQLHAVTVTTTHCYHDNNTPLPRKLHTVTMTTTHCNHDNNTLLPWQQHTVTITTTPEYAGHRDGVTGMCLMEPGDLITCANYRLTTISPTGNSTTKLRSDLFRCAISQFGKVGGQRPCVYTI